MENVTFLNLISHGHFSEEFSTDLCRYFSQISTEDTKVLFTDDKGFQLIDFFDKNLSI